MASYSSDQIQVLRGLEVVRKRPGMFVGNTEGPEGRHHLLWEVVGNVIDLHLVRNASELHVTLGPDAWVTVRDDGPGISIRPRHGVSTLEVILTQLHGGSTFDGHFPHVHVGPTGMGLGLVIVNALSERFEIETTHDGARVSMAFERGEIVVPLRHIGPTPREGTTIRFRPDPQIFGDPMLDPVLVARCLLELAWLNPHLRVFFQERRLEARGGVLGWARRLAGDRGTIECSHGLELVRDEIKVEVGLAWNPTGKSLIHSFANMRRTSSGTHVQGLWAGLLAYARVRNSTARLMSHVHEALEPGLVAIVNVGLLEARYANPVRDHLENPEAAAAVGSLLATSLEHHRYRRGADDFFKRRLRG